MTDEHARKFQHYLRGEEDFKRGVYAIPDVPFFKLQIQEDREYFHGWTYAQGRKRYLEGRPDQSSQALHPGED